MLLVSNTGFIHNKEIMKLRVYRSTWGLVDDTDGQKAKVGKVKL
jgi:hypothetical protein